MAAAARLPCGGRPGRVPDRDRLRARRRRQQPAGGGPALSGQGPARLQSADRPCRRSRRRRGKSRVLTRRPMRLARGILAGTADAGAAQGGRLPGGRSCHRRARHRRDPGSRRTPWRCEILRAFGGPVVAPSANLSGHVSPTTAAHVESDLAGRIDLIVDGGAVEVGVESTIVGCFEAPMLLRPGGLPRGDIERVLGRALAQPPEEAGSRCRPAAGAGHAGLALRAAHAGAARGRHRRARRGAAGVRPRGGAGGGCGDIAC